MHPLPNAVVYSEAEASLGCKLHYKTQASDPDCDPALEVPASWPTGANSDGRPSCGLEREACADGSTYQTCYTVIVQYDELKQFWLETASSFQYRIYQISASTAQQEYCSSKWTYLKNYYPNCYPSCDSSKRHHRNCADVLMKWPDNHQRLSAPVNTTAPAADATAEVGGHQDWFDDQSVNASNVNIYACLPLKACSFDYQIYAGGPIPRFSNAAWTTGNPCNQEAQNFSISLPASASTLYYVRVNYERFEQDQGTGLPTTLKRTSNNFFVAVVDVPWCSDPADLQPTLTPVALGADVKMAAPAGGPGNVFNFQV